MAYDSLQRSKSQTTVPGVLAPSFASPWLLYAYPWMPFPRRVITYLREKGIPETQIKVVRVRDPGHGNDVVDPSMPPRPPGSLPILAIPSKGEDADDRGFIYVRQSNAIISFLEELCNDCQYGFAGSQASLLGTTPLQRARIAEIMALAEECTIAWNPVRMFGTGAGTTPIPEAAKEMLRWVHRSLRGIEGFFKDRDMSLLQKGKYGQVTIADLALFQFLEFVDDCYAVNVTVGSGETVTDPFGRQIEEEYPKLVEFYQTFKTRESSKRDAQQGEACPDWAKEKCSTWADGIF